MTSLAQRLRCTDGQLYTAAISLVGAIVLIVIGLPPVLDGTGFVPVPAAADDRAAPAPATTTTVPTEPPPTSSTTPPVTGYPAPALPSPTMPSPTTTTTTPSPPPVVTDPDRTPQPLDQTLAVIDSGYTSSTAGTPLAGPEVPEDGMPVGVRLGRVDKASYARLAGAGTELRLRLVENPTANQLVAFAAVRACVITEPGWSLSGPGAPPEEAPAHDADRCVDATSDEDGTWTIDIAPLGDFDRGTGIALLPVAEGPVTFQVTFSTVAG